jgi:hypothetical protein
VEFHDRAAHAAQNVGIAQLGGRRGIERVASVHLPEDERNVLGRNCTRQRSLRGSDGDTGELLELRVNHAHAHPRVTGDGDAATHPRQIGGMGGENLRFIRQPDHVVHFSIDRDRGQRVIGDLVAEDDALRRVGKHAQPDGITRRPNGAGQQRQGEQSGDTTQQRYTRMGDTVVNHVNNSSPE